MMETNNPELRQKILTAARELFAQKGVDNVSMRKIAERIGYSATTIYLYYKNKSELLNQLVQEYYQSIIDDSRGIISEMDENPLQSLHSYLILFVRQGLQNPDYFRLMLSLFNDRRNINEAKSQGFIVYNDLLALVNKCCNDAHFQTESPQIVVQSLWSLLIGLTTLLTSHPNFGWENRENLLQYTIDTHLRGLTAKQ